MWSPTLSPNSTARLALVSNLSRNVNRTYDDCWNMPRTFIHCSRKVRHETPSAQFHSHKYTRDAKNSSTLIDQWANTSINATCWENEQEHNHRAQSQLNIKNPGEGTCLYDGDQRITIFMRTFRLRQVPLESSPTSMRGLGRWEWCEMWMWNYGYRVITKQYAVQASCSKI